MPRAVLVVVAALAVVAGCGGDEQPSQETLDVGYSYGMDVGDVGDNLAFARLEEEEGITVSTRDMGGAQQAVVGLTRGDIHLAQLQYTQLLDAVAAGRRSRPSWARTWSRSTSSSEGTVSTVSRISAGVPWRSAGPTLSAISSSGAR